MWISKVVGLVNCGGNIEHEVEDTSRILYQNIVRLTNQRKSLTCRLAADRFVGSQLAGLFACNTLAHNVVHSQLADLQVTTCWLALCNSLGRNSQLADLQLPVHCLATHNSLAPKSQSVGLQVTTYWLATWAIHWITACITLACNLQLWTRWPSSCNSLVRVLVILNLLQPITRTVLVFDTKWRRNNEIIRMIYCILTRHYPVEIFSTFKNGCRFKDWDNTKPVVVSSERVFKWVKHIY